jgi:hypothetical protein
MDEKSLDLKISGALIISLSYLFDLFILPFQADVKREKV